jgi:hypothetical protein
VKASLFCIQKFEVCSHQGSVKRVQTGVSELLKPLDFFVYIAAFFAHGTKLLGRHRYDGKQPTRWLCFKGAAIVLESVNFEFPP